VNIDLSSIRALWHFNLKVTAEEALRYRESGADGMTAMFVGNRMKLRVFARKSSKRGRANGWPSFHHRSVGTQKFPCDGPERVVASSASPVEVCTHRSHSQLPVMWSRIRPGSDGAASAAHATC
jgi:hypothetical protein